jgi:UDP-glucose 4-epimerase
MSALQPILVTGAAGHVGGRLFQQLVAEQPGRVRPAFRQQVELPAWAKNQSPIIGDLGNDAVRRAALAGVSTVVHLATRGHSASQQPTIDNLRSELSVTCALARAAANRGVQKFVFVSSIHVFGDALVGEVSDSTTPLPSTDYGRSRLAIENELTAIGTETGMQVVIVRMTNTFGVPTFPRQALWDLVVHDLCRQAVLTNQLILNTNGTGYRNMLALTDAVGALAQVVVRELPSGTYLLAGSATYQLRHIAEMVKAQAQLLYAKSPTVEINEMDFTQHAHFTLHSRRLSEHGIAVGDHLTDELSQLLHYARREFAR